MIALICSGAVLTRLLTPMQLVLDLGRFPPEALHALERAVREALADKERSIAKLDLRLNHVQNGTHSWLCAARIAFADRRSAAIEVRGVSPISAALSAVNALAPLHR